MKKTYTLRRCVFQLLCALSMPLMLLTSSCQKNVAESSALKGKSNISFKSNTRSVFVSHAVINLSGVSNQTIRGDSINPLNADTACIYLYNCTNIHITRCKLMNSGSYGIYMQGCSNILIDSCLITNVRAGVLAVLCPSGQIRVLSNQMQNMKGPYPHADFVQFDQVAGTFNRISFNKLENQGLDTINYLPEDGINCYKSSGTSTDNIAIVSNEIRGGGPSRTGAGIVVGDGGGNYISVTGNTLVNTGYGGINCAGGSNNSVTNNRIYSQTEPWSGFGLASTNFTGVTSSGNTMSGNLVNWTTYSGSTRDTVWKPLNNPLPSGWSTNTIHASINASMLPTVLIDYH